MRALIGLFVLLLAGCELLAPRGREMTGVNEIVAPEVGAVRAPSIEELKSVNEIVAQAVAAAGAPASEQQRALGLARDAYQRDPGTANRLRLATLLAALPAPLGDDTAAFSLLAPFAAGQRKSPYASFGALLAGQVAERLRRARYSERAIRDERERSARTAQQREDALRQEFERLQHAAEQREAKLREQLEALKSIERGIVEREEKLRNTGR